MASTNTKMTAMKSAAKTKVAQATKRTSAKAPATRTPKAASKSQEDNSMTAPEATNGASYQAPRPRQAKAGIQPGGGASFATLLGMPTRRKSK